MSENEKNLPESAAAGEEAVEAAADGKESGGFTAEQYDGDPTPSGEEKKELPEGTVMISYDLTEEEAGLAMKYFQRQRIYKKNLIFSIILLAVALLYGQAIFTDPTVTLNYFMLLLDLTVIGLIWYLPRRHIRAVQAAVREEKEKYEVGLCPEGLVLPRGESHLLVPFSEPVFTCADFEDFFLLAVSREKMFVLPKRCMDEAALSAAGAFLREGLGERYEEIGKEARPKSKATLSDKEEP